MQQPGIPRRPVEVDQQAHSSTSAEAWSAAILRAVELTATRLLLEAVDLSVARQSCCSFERLALNIITACTIFYVYGYFVTLLLCLSGDHNGFDALVAMQQPADEN